MANWETPHWSGRPQPRREPQRLKPNLFARLARAMARHAQAVTVAIAVIAAAAAIYAAATLRLDPTKPTSVALDPQTTAAEHALYERFPAIDDVFVAKVAPGEASAARAITSALAAALRRRDDLFASVDVPGDTDFDRNYGLLYRSAGEVAAAVRRARDMAPIIEALQSMPHLEGIAALAEQLRKAVDAGQEPQGFAPLLEAFAQSFAARNAGKPKPIDWVALAGLSGEVQNPVRYVIATPRAGAAAAAGAEARRATTGLRSVTWTMPASAMPAGGDAKLSLLAPAFFAALVGAILLAAGLSRLAPALGVAAVTLTVLSLAAAAFALYDPDLDAAEWCFAGVALGPALISVLIYVVAYERVRADGHAPLAAAMLAAQDNGIRIAGIAAITVALWAFWLPRAIPSLAGLAAIASVASGLAVLLTLTLAPAVLIASDRDPAPPRHWTERAAAEPLNADIGNGLGLAVLLLIAFAAFSAVFVSGLRFGDRQPSTRPQDSPSALYAVHFVTPPGAAAQRLLADLGKLPEVGSISWIEQFLPSDIEAKRQALSQLDGLLPPPDAAQPASAETASAVLSRLAASLTAIANTATAPTDLRQASQHLADAVAGFVAAQPPPETITQLESDLFGGLDAVGLAAQRLAGLKPPGIADLNPLLARRFVAADGSWRIEVLPRPGIGRLTFAAAMRRVSPAAAGRPVVDLARNEIMHHEAHLALVGGLAASAFLTLLLLRDALDWAVLQVAAALFACLCAAAVVLGGAPADPAAIAAFLTAMAVFQGSAVLQLLYLRERHGGPPPRRSARPSYRSPLLPPLLLTGALLPLAIAGDAAISHFGFVAGEFAAVALVCVLVMVPQMAGWANSLRRN